MRSDITQRSDQRRARGARSAGPSWGPGCGPSRARSQRNGPIEQIVEQEEGERPIRYYTRGDPITMDFSAARLNVELGADGRIKLFRCG